MGFGCGSGKCSSIPKQVVVSRSRENRYNKNRGVGRGNVSVIDLIPSRQASRTPRFRDAILQGRQAAMTFRTHWNRLWMGLTTVTGVRQKGYFIPYRYAARVAGAPRGSYAALEVLFDQRRETFYDFIQYIQEFSQTFETFGKNIPPEPRWHQVWFPRLDGMAAYALVRRHRPTTIVEVGSGHSTRFMARAIRDAECETRLIAIDPGPRADLSALPAIETLTLTVTEVGEEPFATLAAGDMLVIDSSAYETSSP